VIGGVILKHWARSCIVVGLSIASSGCAQRTDAVDPSWSELVSIAVSPEFPIDNNWRESLEFMPSEAQNKALYDAWQSGMASCMASLGRNFQAGNFYGDLVVDRQNPLNRDLAALVGYHEPSIFAYPQPTNTDANDPEGYAADLEGANGCAGQAAKKTYDLVSFYTERIDGVLQDIMRELADVGDAAQAPLVAAWSDCMKRGGHPFATPHDASTKYSDTEKVTEAEIRIRLADLDCDKEVGLTASRSRAQRTALDAWMTKNSTMMDELRVGKASFDSVVAELS